MTKEIHDLLTAVACGDENAFSSLTEQYAPLVRSMSERFIDSFKDTADISAISVQDLEQEARLALYRAAASYDARQSDVTFGLYAKICIRNSLISLLRKSASAARSKSKSESNAARGGVGDPLSELVSQTEAAALTARIRSALSPYENSIFEQYISGRSVKCISGNVGKTEKSVSNALYRIRVKIKGLLSN